MAHRSTVNKSPQNNKKEMARKDRIPQQQLLTEKLLWKKITAGGSSHTSEGEVFLVKPSQLYILNGQMAQ